MQLEHNYDLSMLYGDTYGYRSGLNASMVRHLQRRVQAIEDRIHLSNGDLVIDIGGRRVELCSALINKSLEGLVIDPSGAEFQQYYEAGTELIPEFFSAAAIRRRVAGQKTKGRNFNCDVLRPGADPSIRRPDCGGTGQTELYEF